ncbi:MAG: Fe-S cluster assembly ATPase SufC [bacterium]|nr:Fe-S cluster assembly ATPase SufC [bacterium]
MSLLEIKNLHVEIEGKKVLNGLNLTIEQGEVHVIMGPNGSGKSTLTMSILGYPGYNITDGTITFARDNISSGTELNTMPIYERARLGISIAYQTPPEIRGVKLRDIIRIAGSHPLWNPHDEPEENVATPLLKKVGLNPEQFRDRDIGVGFSGGERKRAEIAQVFAAMPKLMILDEPDSGVDIDSLKTIAIDLGEYIKEHSCACLIITHYRHILPYLKPDIAHVMCGGKIMKSGNPFEIFTRIEEKGYCEYLGLCPPGIRDEIERGMEL